MIDFEMHILSQCEILLGMKYEVSRIIQNIETFNPNDKTNKDRMPKEHSLEIGLVFFIIKLKWGS
jgi:hypothetical protein